MRRALVAVALASLAASGGACILIERYDPLVPDGPDGGGGRGGQGSSTSTTTTSPASSTSSSSGGTTSSTTSATGGAGGATTSSTATGSGGGATSSSSSSSSSSSGLLGTALWAHAFGGGLDDATADVATDAAGSVIVVGSFQGDVDFGGGPITSGGATDAFVVKLDSAGNHLWSRGFGDAAAQVAVAAGTDAAGNIYVAGNFQGAIDFGGPSAPLVTAGQGDVFLAKLDPAGATIWAKRFGDASHQSVLGRAIAIEPGGDVLLAATITGSIDFGDGPVTSAGGQDVVLAKLDKNGAPLWKHVFGDAADQSVRGLARSANGRVAIVGSMGGVVDFGGGPLAAAGPSMDVFVALFSDTGVHQWSKRFGDASTDQLARTVAFDPQQTVWVGGSFFGSLDLGGGPLAAVGAAENAFIARLSDTGAHLVSRAYGDGSTPGQAVRRLAADGLGDVVMVGDYCGAIDFGAGALPCAGALDAFIVKVGPTLATKFAHTYGDGSIQSASAVALDAVGHIVVGGNFRSSLNLGLGALPSAGASDAFVVELTP